MKKILTKLKEYKIYIIVLIASAIIFNIKLPYYVMAPGDIITIDNRIETTSKKESTGNINLLYVTEYEGTVSSVVMSFLMKNWDLEKLEEVQLSNETPEEIKLRNKVMLDNSIQNAIFVAYNSLGKEIKITNKRNIVIGTTNDNEIKINDEILKINDIEVESVDTIKEVIKDTNISDKVKLTVKRNDKELTFKVTKENITLFSVSSEMLDNNGKNVGYLSVSIFGQKTYSQFKDALTKLEKQDMDSLIIDLRGNTGGYLSTVTNMLEEFIDKGNVIYQIQSSSGVKQYKTVKASDKKYKIVVLIDGGSASASEIMSAAMKEVYGATLVGQTTYGKGTVQTTKDLSNGSMIKYTIEKWLTPSGKNIDKEGIKPDYEVELGDSYKNNPTKENDAQLQKALDLLK